MSQYPGIVQFIIDVRTLRPEMASKHARAGTKRFCTLIIGRRTLCGGHNPLISSLATEEKKESATGIRIGDVFHGVFACIDLGCHFHVRCMEI